MVLLDRAAHPRHKLCGGGVTRFGLQLLRGLDIPVPLPIPHAVVRDARFIYKNRTVHVYGNPEIVIFNRPEFDQYLAETARRRGAVIHENEKVVSLVRDSDGVTVTSEKAVYRAQVVVGADGSRGVTRNELVSAKASTRVARLLESVHSANENAPQFEDEYAIFDFTPANSELQGYTWDFPSRVNGLPHHNRGIYDARMSKKRVKASLPALLNRSLTEKGSPKNEVRIEGHPIHWFSPRTVMAGKRLVLAGDAAGAEPLFGEGIAPALGYGKKAAEAIIESFRNKDFSFNSYKRRILLSRLGFYLLLRWYIAWWSYRLSGHDWFMRILWKIGRGLTFSVTPRPFSSFPDTGGLR